MNIFNVSLNPPRAIQEKWDRNLAIVAVIAIVAAWILGTVLNSADAPDCTSVLPGAELCRSEGSVYEGVVINDDQTETVVGWARVAAASGYSGKISVLVGVSPDGTISGVSVIDQTETPAYISKVMKSDFMSQFIGMPADSAFVLDDDLDGVTSATYSSRAIAAAVQDAGHSLAFDKLGMQVEVDRPQIKFGLPELLLIALFATGFVAHRGGFKYQKAARWGTMLVGLVMLGFVYNAPLTIAHINSFLLGFWPSWQDHLYWYLLLGGVFFVVLKDNKNPYCSWFCPFGAAQECLGTIGGAKLWSPGNYRYVFKLIQRFLALSAIILGLLWRNPGFSSYEIFGTLFSFNGATLQWIVLVVILLLSLFVRRPWCEYLCPIDPVVDFVQAARRWTRSMLTKVLP